MDDDQWGHFIDTDIIDQETELYIKKYDDFESSSFINRTDSIYDFENDPFYERITFYFRGIIFTIVIGWYFFI